MHAAVEAESLEVYGYAGFLADRVERRLSSLLAAHTDWPDLDALTATEQEQREQIARRLD